MKDKLSLIRRVAVYCGSHLPKDEVYVSAARDFARFLAEHEMTLVYGGSNVGLMKILADTVLANGGCVIGVFPENLPEALRHTGLTESILTSSLAERKSRMLELADAVVALPGSFGTWDELFDALALRKMRRGGHKHPVGILNVNGYFDPLLLFIENSVKTGFTGKKYEELLKVGRSPSTLFRQLAGNLVLDSDKK